MRQFLISFGFKLIIATLMLCAAYFVVSYSSFYYLFIGNILLLLGFSFLSEAFFYLIIALFKGVRKRKTAIISTSRSTFIVIFIADIIIRLTGMVQTYPERTDGRYFSSSKQEKMDSWYWVHTPNTVINNQKKEFVFNREVNSIGLSENEIEKEKGSKFRILAIGDSFTESVGVSYEDSWVKQMESRWKSKNVQSINAGVGGSDPVYEFALYRDKLVELEPDVVVLTINSTDVSDIVGRGGFERFRADGTAGKEPPSWEWIYASNHLFRMVMHSVFNYNSNLIQNANSEESQMEAVSILKETLSELKNMCADNNTKLLVVLQPSIQEFKEGIHTPFFGQRSLENYMKSEKIHFLDASPQFQSKGKSVSDYYYPLDTHFNKKGYSLFGETVYQKIEELKFLDK